MTFIQLNKIIQPAALTWADVLAEEKKQAYFLKLLAFIQQEREAGQLIYPAQDELFNAFEATPYDQVKVVILGQDPYHGPGQAHGLSFSVKQGVKPPPSLRNLFLELNNDLGITLPNHGCLTRWAQQGVLLLNTSLSVVEGKPQSHAKIGWSVFTDAVIKQLNNHPLPLVFLLWGRHAEKKGLGVDGTRHLVLTAPHPSPFSAHQGFFGCRHFSKANDFLKAKGRIPVDWSLYPGIAG